MTAAEAFEHITDGGSSDFASAVEILDRHRPWCLIGGLSVNCYVEPVYTVDADVVVVTAELDEVADELTATAFRVERFARPLNAHRGGSELNLQFTTDARYQDFLSRARPAQVLGLSVPVAALSDVVRGKIWAWQDSQRRFSKRKKDELDLIRIAETYPEIRAILPHEIVSQLP